MNEPISYRLSPAQSEIFKSKARFRVAACGRRFGKALALDTPILTIGGWSTMGRLKIGDYVFGSDGLPTQVIKTTRVFEKHECYRLIFSTGEEIIADAGHLWRIHDGERERTVTTNELYWLNPQRDCVIERRNFHILQEEEEVELIEYFPPIEVRFRSIEPIDSVPVKCIEVSARDHLFLCGETLIPTHNSYLSVFELLQAASVPNSQCWYVTSSYRAAKQIIWEVLKEILVPTGFVVKINESELLLRLVNNSKIQLKGTDNSDSLRGVGLDFLVIDEAAFVDERVWKEVLRPTLSDTGGSALFISSPSGRDWFYKLWLMGSDPEFPDWQSWQFTTLQGGNVPDEEIEAARRDLDERTFQQEYEAQFSDYYGIIYYNYDPIDSSSDYTVDMSKPFMCGIDMNIDPMSCVVAQREMQQNGVYRKAGPLHIVDEIVLYSSNTDELAQEIKNRYPVSLCTLYPDPACVQRKTSAGGKTDLSILQSNGFKVRLRHQHPPVRDRINSVNTLLKASEGTRNLYINRRCRHLGESLSRQVYKEGTSIPDKSRGYDHLCFSAKTKVFTKHGYLSFEELPDTGHVKDVRNQWVPYMNLRCTRESAKVARLTFQNKHTTFSLICTPNHEILTVHGFFEAQELRDGERICKMLPHYRPPSNSRKIEIKNDLDDLLAEIGPQTQQGLTQCRLVDYEELNQPQEVWCLFVPRYHHFQVGTPDNPILVKNCVIGSTKIKTPLGPIAIKDLKDGMYVSTVAGQAPVLGCQITGLTDIFEVKLEDGQTIECSADHKFLTQRGFVEAQDLTSEDRMICSSLWKKAGNTSLMVSVTEKIQEALTSITHAARKKIEKLFCTVPSGNSTKVQFPGIFMSITSIITGKITQSKI